MSRLQSIQAKNPLADVNAVIPLSIAGVERDQLSLAIKTTEKGVAGIDYVHDLPALDATNQYAQEAVYQLQCYFKNPDWQFDLPLDLAGTSFQKQLWQTLKKVPAGNVQTYGELARQLGSGAQAVGQACRRNPVPVILPCHRIVSRQGMGGYAGEIAGEKMRIKNSLLLHEGYSGD